ncbi:MAG: response regulator [Spirochaetaceae bacterium]|nr:MAG: response regulator [Spirochaetaceae bacterium]
MDYLVAEAAANIRDSLCYVLLSFGIKGIPAANKQEALDILQNNNSISGAIIDLDSKEVDGVELITALRAQEGTQHLSVIAHTVQSSKELVNRMMEFGVIGYLLKPYVEKDAFVKLKKVLASGESHNAQRKHIRVRPDPNELLRLHFKLPGQSSLFSGKVVDISVGGVAVELFNPPASGVLAPGTHIPGIQFTLNRKAFSPPGKVILFKEQLLALRFDYLSPSEMSALSKYVFKRLTS